MNLLDIHIACRDRFELECGYQPYSSIFYLLSGSFEIEINGAMQMLRKGDILYLPKSLYFKRRIIEKITFYYLRFSGDEKYISLGGILERKNILALESKLKCLFHTAEQSDEIRQAKNVLLESIFCQYQLERSLAVNFDDAKIQKCVNYIAMNFSQDIDLEKLSSISDCSKTVVIEKFKKHYGMTPIHYLNTVRMNAAKQALIDSQNSIAEIAEQCGFNCPYYFSNTFKKHFGESPRQYRRKHSI